MDYSQAELRTAAVVAGVEAIKYAWMQYFYIFLPIYIILYVIYKFIMESNIFYSHVKSDL